MNRKLIWKFNIIDLLIIAILLLSLLALVYRAVSGSGEEKRDYTLTYICEEAPLNLLREIELGSLSIDGELGTELGEITAINITPYPESDTKGSAAIATVVKGAKGEHGINIGDGVYLKGKTLNLIINDSLFEVYIKNIE